MLMGIECVRIDIFITHGKPNGCVINEDSISSGMNYGPHFEFLTKAWCVFISKAALSKLFRSPSHTRARAHTHFLRTWYPSKQRLCLFPKTANRKPQTLRSTACFSEVLDGSADLLGARDLVPGSRALPHLSKRYNVYNSTRPVYMQTEKDVPGLAPKLKGSKPAYRSHVNVLGRHR